MVNFTTLFNLQASGISLNSPGTPFAGSSFPITGSIVGFSTPPSLVYRDDGTGAEFPITTVTINSFSFTHPGMQAGSHTVEVYPPGAPGSAGSISFTVQPAFTPGAVNSIAVLATTANSLQLTWAEPDTQQIYTYSVDVSSTGSSGPFQMNFSGITLTGSPKSYLLTGLTRNTNYWVKIAAVANQTLIGPATTTGPFLTGQQPVIALNPVIAFTGSFFEVSGTIS